MGNKRIILIVMAVTAITILLTYFTIFSPRNMNIKRYNDEEKKYHFAVIFNNTMDPYWESLREGCLSAANEYNLDIQFLGAEIENIEKEKDFFRMAIRSKVDGIAIHANNDKEFYPIINKAVENEIPIVTMVNDSPSSKRNIFIGVDNYNIGTKIAKSVLEAIGSEGNIALIIGNSNSDLDINMKQKILGFNNYLKSYRNLFIVKQNISTSEIISAEQSTREILDIYGSIDAIVCMTTIDTLGAAKVVKEKDRFDRTKVIGVEATVQILKDINNGIIHGVIVSNPYKIGYNSIKALYDLKEKGETNVEVQLSPESINNDNLYDYILNKKQLNIKDIL